MANKTFHNGRWHLVTDDKRLGPPTDPFVQGVDNPWVEDGAFGDYIPKYPPWDREERAPPPPPEPVPRPGQKVYKVLTQRDAYFGGKFDPDSLQRLINRYACEDWRVVSMTATDVSSFWGSFWSKGGGATRQELVILFEKTVA